MFKSFIITTIVFLCLNSATAQTAKNDTTVYYLTNTERVTFSKDSAAFFLVILPPDASADKELYPVKEYYANGKTRFATSFKGNTIKKLNYQGSFISFYPNGHKKKICNYEDGQSVGDEITYYPSGKLYNVKQYNNGDRLLLSECHDTTGAIMAENGNGKWINYFGDDFISYEIGDVKNGIAYGEFKGRINDSVDIISVYNNGKVVASARFDNPTKSNSTVDVMPQFGNDDKGFGAFFGGHLERPQVLRVGDFQAIVTFTIDKNGLLGNFSTKDGGDKEFDQRAIKVFKLSPPWKPGTVNGMPVRVVYTATVGSTLKLRASK